MTCKECGSENVGTFSSEMAIHITGLKNINVPAVFIFPRSIVCFHCGAGQFAVPNEELRTLQKREAANRMKVTDWPERQRLCQ
jgi:hypothetical protein